MRLSEALAFYSAAKQAYVNSLWLARVAVLHRECIQGCTSRGLADEEIWLAPLSTAKC